MFRDVGYDAHVVEKWQPQSRRRIDLFGFADVVAMREGSGIVAVQACTGSSHADRKAKILAEPKALTWLKSGGRIELVSWRKAAKPVNRKWWTCRREEITQGDFA
jgi:hypothetical protein